MRSTDVAIIGGGQAGLAMSRCLSGLGVEHVVLERGRVAERWRERWDSLRLLTPNWQTRLPGFQYDGDDPEGFMRAADVVAMFERYARSFEAPVEPWTTVLEVSAAGRGFLIRTDRGGWRARAVVVATGDSDVPVVPRVAARLASDVQQVASTAYRRPDQLPDGGVLIVGASATGIQLADELQRAGRDVVVAVGHHIRLPRSYRGLDIMRWLDATGILEQRADQVYDISISRQQPSFQLVGRPDRTSIDLRAVRDRGARVVGRLVDAEGHRVRFADDLVATTAASDAKLAVLLARLDAFAAEKQLAGIGAPEPFTPLWPEFIEPETMIDLRAERVGTVLWATGYRRRYPWLRVPVLDAAGEIRHAFGVTPQAGLYVMGLRFMRRRNSNFIDGVARDARDLAGHLAAYLGVSERAIA